jgi:hypothetical protein
MCVAQDAGVMNRLEGIEREIGRLVRMMHEPPPPQQQPRATAWAEPMPSRAPAFRSQSGNIPITHHHIDSKWCAINPTPHALACRSERHNLIHLLFAALGLRRGKHQAPAATSDKRPVWDFQKVLGQWAEERDVTRDLLNQHTNWIDTVQRELVPK